MIYPQIVDYIKNSLGKNISLEQIKKSLLEKGWKEWDINEAIALVNPSVNSKPASKNDNSKKKISPAFILIIVGVFSFILVIGFGIYFLATMSPSQLSDDEIAQGAVVSLNSGKEIKFNLNEEEHKIVVGSFYEDSVKFVIYSDPLEVTLRVGQTEKFDINSDNVYDLSIKLNSMTAEKADFYIKEINEAICVAE